MKPVMTRHALTRSKERIGLDRKASARLAGIALEKGLTAEEIKGELKRSVKNILDHSRANEIRIYAEKVFLFNYDEIANVFVLITVLPLENQFKETVRRLMKQRERQS